MSRTSALFGYSEAERAAWILAALICAVNGFETGQFQRRGSLENKHCVGYIGYASNFRYLCRVFLFSECPFPVFFGECCTFDRQYQHIFMILLTKTMTPSNLQNNFKFSLQPCTHLTRLACCGMIALRPTETKHRPK